MRKSFTKSPSSFLNRNTTLDQTNQRILVKHTDWFGVKMIFAHVYFTKLVYSWSSCFQPVWLSFFIKTLKIYLCFLIRVCVCEQDCAAKKHQTTWIMSVSYTKHKSYDLSLGICYWFYMNYIFYDTFMVFLYIFGAWKAPVPIVLNVCRRSTRIFLYPSLYKQ